MPGTVTVACKVPNGLILRVFEMVKVNEASPLGYREIDKARPKGKEVVINGPAFPVGQSPRAPISGGFALTHNVDADFFAEWVKQNRDSELVQRKLIFAQEKPENAQKQAKEQKAEMSGLEPINPNKLPKLTSRKNIAFATATDKAD